MLFNAFLPVSIIAELASFWVEACRKSDINFSCRFVPGFSVLGCMVYRNTGRKPTRFAFSGYFRGHFLSCWILFLGSVQATMIINLKVEAKAGQNGIDLHGKTDLVQ